MSQRLRFGRARGDVLEMPDTRSARGFDGELRNVPAH